MPEPESPPKGEANELDEFKNLTRKLMKVPRDEVAEVERLEKANRSGGTKKPA